MADLPDMMAFGFDGRGGAVRLSLDELSDLPSDTHAFTWVHLRRDAAGAREWLGNCGADTFVIEALTAEETRPRCTVHGLSLIHI